MHDTTILGFGTLQSSLTPEDLLKESLHAMVPSNQLGSTAPRAHRVCLAGTPGALAAGLTDLVTCLTLYNLEGRSQFMEANRALRSIYGWTTLFHLQNTATQPPCSLQAA